MSASTQRLEKQIAMAQDLGGVVRSMKALAASRVSQYEHAVVALDRYAYTVNLGLGACFRGVPPQLQGHILATPDPAPNVVIVFGSDQGLVGSFNQTLVDHIDGSLGDAQRRECKIWAVGESTLEFLDSGRQAELVALPAPVSVTTVGPLVGQILIRIEDERENNPDLAVTLFHNQPRGGAGYEAVATRLLPLDRVWQDQIRKIPWPTKLIVELMDGSVAMLPALIESYLFVMLFKACAESLASENVCRLAAMGRAEKNIAALLDNMNRSFHRFRQEAIDEELFDVISGFEALTGKVSTV